MAGQNRAVLSIWTWVRTSLAERLKLSGTVPKEPAKRVDHRPRVAAKRRAQMQARLFSAALELLAKTPISNISINDLIDRVGVSRGTFYKYFDSLAHVFFGLSARLEEELSPIADQFIARIPDAATRVATGTRLVLHFGSSTQVFGKLMVQSGWPVAHSASTFLGFLARDIQLAMRQGTFEEMPESVAANLIIGPMLGGLQAMLLGQTAPGYPEQLTLRILLSLGMPRASAEQAILVPIPELPLSPSGFIGEILKISQSP